VRTWVGWLVIITVVIVVLGLIGSPIYIGPATNNDENPTVDVVLVLGPPTNERMQTAQKMIDEGRATAMMVSLDPDATEYTIAQSTCTARQDFEIYCKKPIPFSTRGEAEWLAAMTQEHKWSSAAVVTFRPQITRARALINRCDVDGLKMIDSGEEIIPVEWFYQYAYQTLGFIKMGPAQGC